MKPDKHGTLALGDLPAGTRVSLGSQDLQATVVRQSLTSVAVDIHRVKERSFTTKEGEKVKIFKSTERTTWSPGTRVRLVD